MNQMTQIILRPGPITWGDGSQSDLTATDLQRLRENTLALLRRGFEIPVLPRHDVAGSVDGGPQQLPVRAVNSLATVMPPAGIGHLIDLVQRPDGALAQVIELYENAGDVTFTSPELRPSWTDSTGTQHGPIIAHVALTDRPLSRGQTPLTPVADHEDFPFHVSLEGEEQMNPTNEQAIPTEDRDDIPREDVETPLPHEQQPEKPETDVLADDFSEEDTVLAEEDVVEVEESAKPPAVVRSRLAERIRASRTLPKGLRDRLSATVETLQLSDDANAVPTIPVAEAVAMIEAAMPENLQFGDGDLHTPPHPRGENFFTCNGSALSDDDAERIASEQLAATGFGPVTG